MQEFPLSVRGDLPWQLHKSCREKNIHPRHKGIIDIVVTGTLSNPRIAQRQAHKRNHQGSLPQHGTDET
mgnify:CR=1 FL=1